MHSVPSILASAEQDASKALRRLSFIKTEESSDALTQLALWTPHAPVIAGVINTLARRNDDLSALNGLGRIGIDHADELVRHAAIRALARRRDEAALQRLLDVGTHSRCACLVSQELEQRLYRDHEFRQRDDVLGFLLEALHVHATDRDLRLWCLMGLRWVRSDRTIVAFLNHADDSDPDVAAIAKQEVGSFLNQSSATKAKHSGA